MSNSIARVININHVDCEYIFIGRGSCFGNPYKVKIYGRKNACDNYEKYFDNELENENSLISIEFKKILNRLISGENVCLGCFCHPKQCHGDHIAKRLNQHFDFI